MVGSSRYVRYDCVRVGIGSARTLLRFAQEGMADDCIDH